MSKNFIDTKGYLISQDREWDRAVRAAEKLQSKIPAKFNSQLLYIITPEDLQRPVKLGISHRPRYRLASLQMGYWNRLEIFKLFRVGNFAYRLEKHLHSHLESKRLSGEWFDIHAIEADKIVQEYFRANINHFKNG